MAHILCFAGILFLVSLMAPSLHAQELFRMPAKTETRWVSFENPTAAKGEGGQRNEGGKGAAFEPVKAGETKVLLDFQGSGTVRRMWITLRDRGIKSLRSAVLRAYWDGAEKPAVEVPLGDFFGAVHGRAVPFESELFSNPEGRCFNGYIPMPFRTAAKITFTNESDEDFAQLFYEIDLTVGDDHPPGTLYFHAYWHRQRWTELRRDFEILPKVSGKGRYLGAHIGVIGHPDNKGWWGEGEVKMYLDGDVEWPTIVGTGTEDYAGTAWELGEFASRFHGALLVDNDNRRWIFYRYHVPDPVYFHQDIRVTIQQLGGAYHREVREMLKAGIPIDPVSVMTDDEMILLKERTEPFDFDDPKYDDAWTNIYRRDDVCAVALFYLDQPVNALPPIAPVEARLAGLFDGE